MMNDEIQKSGLSPAVAARVDQLLAAWRREHRLDDYTAAAIRQSVVGQGEELSAQWWQEHRERVNALVAQTRRLAHELAGLAWANAQPGSRWRVERPLYTPTRQAYVRLG